MIPHAKERFAPPIDSSRCRSYITLATHRLPRAQTASGVARHLAVCMLGIKGGPDKGNQRTAPREPTRPMGALMLRGKGLRDPIPNHSHHPTAVAGPSEPLTLKRPRIPNQTGGFACTPTLTPQTKDFVFRQKEARKEAGKGKDKLSEPASRRSPPCLRSRTRRCLGQFSRRTRSIYHGLAISGCRKLHAVRSTHLRTIEK